jgi:peroxiredoxin
MKGGREFMMTKTDVAATAIAPEDDGQASHLKGSVIPTISLQATDGTSVYLQAPGLTVVYAYPRTSPPNGQALDGWDAIPGARGCTPQSCAFRDHFRHLQDLGVHRVFGLSTQVTDYQIEVASRLHLPFPLLSDHTLAFSSAMRLPRFDADGLTLLKRMTMIIEDGRIEHVFYPVFPPERNVDDVIRWLAKRPRPAGFENG